MRSDLTDLNRCIVPCRRGARLSLALRSALVLSLATAAIALTACERETGTTSRPAEPTAQPPAATESGTAHDTTAARAVTGENETHATPSAATGSTPTPSLLVEPLVAIPTADGATINVVVDPNDDGRDTLRLQTRPARSDGEWSTPREPTLRGPDVAEWRLASLEAGTEYDYRIVTAERMADVAHGAFTTLPEPGASFRVALLADTHVFARTFDDAELAEHPLPAESVEGLRASRQEVLETMPQVVDNVLEAEPDLLFHLGDLVDWHGFGFNPPPPSRDWMRRAWLEYRRLLGELGARVPHVMVIGNWDGENGDFPEQTIADARAQRRRYVPNPAPVDSPHGGSPHRDYFAVRAGDAVFIVLNVMSYTPTPHLLSTGETGAPDTWTLGEAQMAWFEETLASTDATWRFVMIHHPVGGDGGDPANSAYGRGGGRAADVGEQARVHELMKTHDVQVFFYGHDHVFTDMVVDGIHYTLPGSAGAPWRFDVDATGYEEAIRAPGHGLIDVSPERVEVRFVGIDGEVLDEYTLVNSD